MSRPLCVILLALLAGCDRRDPPRGSGALETTPSASAIPTARPLLRSWAKAAPYPNGTVLSTDPEACKAEALRDGKALWTHDFENCGGLLEGVVALDSVAFIRDAKSLWALDLGGKIRWKMSADSANLPGLLAPPTALADSRVAMAVTPSKIAVYETDGTMAWSFSTPTEEALVAPPAGMKTEGLTMVTSQAVYLLSATGEIRWRMSRAARPGAER